VRLDVAATAGVVHQNVETVIGPVGELHQVLDVIANPDVGAHEPRSTPLGLDLPHGLLAEFSVDVGDHHRGTLTAQPLCDGASRASRRAGHHRGLACKLHVASAPNLRPSMVGRSYRRGLTRPGQAVQSCDVGLAHCRQVAYQQGPMEQGRHEP
jgi:hypothetical protein